jgi:signal peptidase II
MVVLVLIDQISKCIIVENFFEGETISLINNFLHITYVRNYGVAFGLFQGKINIISIVTITAIVFIICHIIKNKNKQPLLEKLGFMLILSGAVGNMIDRIFRGFVVDMIDFRGIWRYVFNGADAWINIGVAIIILDYIITSRKKI